MSTEKEIPQPPTKSKDIERQRSGEFESKYANHVWLESSTWDLRLTFGEYDSALGENAVSQHTAITLPWPEVKVLAYLLQVHLTLHEADFGRLLLHSGAINPVPEEVPKEFENNPSMVRAYKMMRQLYTEFIAANPEVVNK